MGNFDPKNDPYNTKHQEALLEQYNANQLRILEKMKLDDEFRIKND